MQEYVELSHTLEDRFPVYPGDKEVRIYKNRFIDIDGYNDKKLEMGMHVGTHIDTPGHLLNRETYISDYPLEKFIGRGYLLDVRSERVIGMKEEYSEKIKEGDIVLIYTGYDEKCGNEEYFKDHPVIEKTLAEFFTEKKIKMVGMDMPSPDGYPFEIHKILLEENILIIENLRNLGKLKDSSYFEVIALPMNIKAEAAPARVIARHLK